MSFTNTPHERHAPSFVPDINACRESAEKFLDELAADGIGESYTEGNRSAHWWVGCLSSQLEHFLAATNPERTK